MKKLCLVVVIGSHLHAVEEKIEQPVVRMTERAVKAMTDNDVRTRVRTALSQKQLLKGETDAADALLKERMTKLGIVWREVTRKEEPKTAIIVESVPAGVGTGTGPGTGGIGMGAGEAGTGIGTGTGTGTGTGVGGTGTGTGTGIGTGGEGTGLGGTGTGTGVGTGTGEGGTGVGGTGTGEGVGLAAGVGGVAGKPAGEVGTELPEFDAPEAPYSAEATKGEPALEGVPAAPELEGAPAAPELEAEPEAGKPAVEKEPAAEKQAVTQTPEEAAAALKAAIEIEDKQVLSGEDQKASDVALESVLIQLARDIEYQDLPKYLKRITDDLRRLLGTKIKPSKFKKPARLQELVGVTQKAGIGKPETVLVPGLLEMFVKTRLTVPTDSTVRDQFLNALYLDMQGAQTVVGAFKDLLAPLFFQKNGLVVLAEMIETLLVNIVVSQRTVVAEPLELAQKKSDILVANYLKSLLEDVAKEEAVVKEKQLVDAQKKKEAEDKAKKQEAWAAGAEPAAPVAPAVAPAEESFITLSKDWLVTLRHQINYLRVHPSFLRFNTLLGQKLKTVAEGKQNELEKIKLMPLLYALHSKNQSYFVLKNIISPLQGQLVFDGERIGTLVRDTNIVREVVEGATTTKLDGAFVFKMILENHVRLLIEATGDIEVGPYLAGRLKDVETVKEIISVLRGLLVAGGKKLGDKTVLVNAIIDALGKPAPDADAIVAQFTQLVAPDALDTENIIRAAVEAELKARAQKNKVIAIVQAIAAKKYEQEGKTVDVFAADELEKIGALARYKEDLAGVYRFPGQVQKIFVRLLDSATEVTKAGVSKRDFYTLFAPYGLFTKMLNQFATEAEKATANQQKLVKMLRDSFEAINRGEKQAQADYFEVIGTEGPSVIQFPYYKNRVQSLLLALDVYDINKMLSEVAGFVAAPGLGVEKSGAYLKLVVDAKTQLIAVLLKILKDEISMINTRPGEVLIKGLPMEGAVEERNIAIYELLKGKVQALVAELAKDSAALDAAAFDAAVAKLKTDIATALDAAKIPYASLPNRNIALQKDDILSALNTYFDAVASKVRNIVAARDALKTERIEAEKEQKGQAAPAAEGVPAAPPLEEGGVPAAPPMDGDGGVPAAPPL